MFFLCFVAAITRALPAVAGSEVFSRARSPSALVDSTGGAKEK